jgi:ABC-type multidrug transport system fused ATPase/permease subunit
MAALLVVGVFARALLLLNANVMGYWADSLCEGGAGCKAVPTPLAEFGAREYVLTLLGVTAVGFVLNTVFRVGVARIGTHAVSTLYDETTLRTSRLPLSFFDRTPVGRIVARFSSDYNAVFRMAGGPMGEFFCILFDLALTFVLISVASPLYIPLIVLTIALNAAVYRLNKNAMRRERRSVSVARGPAIAHFAETAQGARSIRAFGKSRLFSSRFGKLVRQFLAQRGKTLVLLQAFSLQMSLITSLLLLATGLLGIWFVREGWVSVGSVAVAFTFVMLTSSTVQQLFEYIANMEEALTGVERLDDYLRRDLEPGAALPTLATFPTAHPRLTVAEEVRIRGAREAAGTLPALPRGALRVEGLALRYRPELPRVLDGVSFALRPGEHVGVVGRTGCGKSSLIQALFLLYPWESGTLSLDGRTPMPLPGGDPTFLLPEYRSRLSLIPQDPALFRGSLRENLTVSPLHDASFDDRLESVLRTVGLGDWFDALGRDPFGFAVEERGANLSSGQRQLLCMARCLLQESDVVVMDEATSSVDPVSEEKLLHASRDLLSQRTQIIVAHRLTTIEHCHTVLWLQDGRVFRSGPPEVILPAYRSQEGVE